MTNHHVELWLMRHGETEWSLSGAHTSRTDIPLTENGRKLAGKLREFLAGKHFDEVRTSPMQRARETCRLAGLDQHAIIDDGLKEWDYGVYEGRTTKEIREQEPGWDVWSNEIRGGESVDQVGKRADEVIERSLQGCGEGDPCRVALFAHAHILRILAARWLQLPAREGSLFALSTGSVSRLGWERERRVIVEWNRSFDEAH